MMISPNSHQQFFIITGGPGSGKSTLIQALSSAGYHCTAEAGRAIIQEQVQIGGAALPWMNPTLFAELMLSREIRSYQQAQLLEGSVFFDRGIPDVMGYLRLMNREVPAQVVEATKQFRYHPIVLIAPPWPEIFSNDSERKQNFDESVQTYEAMVNTYTECGYGLMELPRTSVPERVAFVIDQLRPEKQSRSSGHTLNRLS